MTPFSLLVGGVGVLLALGSAFAILRSRSLIQNLTLLRDERDDWQKAFDRSEKVGTQCSTEIAELKIKVRYLEQIVTSAEAIKDLGTKLDHQHSQLMAAIGALAKANGAR